MTDKMTAEQALGLLCSAIRCGEDFHEHCERASGIIRQALTAPRVPEGFAVIADNLRTQDNRMTADPLFVVFEKREVVVDGDYQHDRIVWFGDEGVEADAEQTERLDAIQNDVDSDQYLESEIELEGMKWRKLAILEVDSFVTACFTEAGARAYLEINGHNLRKPFIYADGLYRNEEMKGLRHWLMQLPAAPAPADDEPKASIDDIWVASGKEYDRAIHDNPDHYAWAELFVSTFPNLQADVETMAGWFANAMMAKADSITGHTNELATLRERVKVLEDCIEGFIGIVSDSKGVAGYHLNGDVALWDEFEVIDVAGDLLSQRDSLRGGSDE
jgi:hypothetical protein